MSLVLFRADASTEIGAGHILRCLVLADDMKKRGWDTVFLSQKRPGNLFETIRSKGHSLFELPMNGPSGDLACVRGMIRGLPARPDWIVVDHYDIDRGWESQIRNLTSGLLAIDDEARRAHDCDILLNPNPTPGLEKRYRSLVSPETRLLLGLPFLLLSPFYGSASKQSTSRKTPRILISYGGADPSGETLKALRVIARLRTRAHFEVVIGPSNPRRKQIENAARGLRNVTLHLQPPHLANLMKRADLCLSAGGNTVYELLKMGVPSLVTTTAKNQIPAVKHLHRQGQLRWLGSRVSASRIEKELEKALSIATLKKAKQCELIDGKGAKRVTQAMKELTTHSLRIENHRIGSSNRPFVIAEMSANHNGSLERALEITKAAARAGAHAIKLQTFEADSLTVRSDSKDFSIDEKGNLWEGRTLHSLYREAETPWEWHAPIMKLAKHLGLMCFSSPFHESAVDFLETLNVPCYKIASFEINHLPLIQKVAETGKPIFLSTGMASLNEIAEAVTTAKKAGARDIVLLKCTSAYPTRPDDANILTIPDLRKRFMCEVGLSDHSDGIGTAIAAVAHGATVIEKHFTLSRRDGGLDATFSLEPKELKSLVIESERAWRSLGSVKYGPLKSEIGSFKERRSLYIVKNLKRGDILTEENLRCIRPGFGLHPKHYTSLLGKRINRDIKKATPMSWELIR